MKQLYLIVFIALVITACTSNQKDAEKADVITGPTPLIQDTSYSTTCPFLTDDGKGNIVLNFIKEFNDSEAVVCYLISSDEGKTFGEPVEIPASRNVHPHPENMPKIIFKPNGEIISVWGAGNPNPKNKYSGLVYYSQSFDEGKTWSNATLLVNDTGSYDQRYFDIALLNNGEAGIIWLDNRKQNDKEGSTIYFASTSGNDGFKNEIPFAESICQCCRTDLFIDKSGAIHANYRDIINDSIRDMVHCVSTDNGKTFSNFNCISNDNWVISGCPHTGPCIAENDKGLHFTWYTMGTGEGVFYCNSSDNGKTFSKKENVSKEGSAKHPQIRTLENENIVILWDESVKSGERYNMRIGCQLRSHKGEVIKTSFITSENDVAAFPVLMPLGENRIIVAYTQKQGKNERVYYQSEGF